MTDNKANGVKPSKEVAGMMLSAIISDTVLFRSPTTTDEDKAAVKELAEIAGVDYEASYCFSALVSSRTFMISARLASIGSRSITEI